MSYDAIALSFELLMEFFVLLSIGVWFCTVVAFLWAIVFGLTYPEVEESTYYQPYPSPSAKYKQS